MMDHRLQMLHTLAADLAQRYQRIAVAGGPLTGKSIFGQHIPPERRWVETDQFMDQPWDQQPQWATWALNGYDEWLLTGVQTGRVLRKGLEPQLVVWLATPLEPLSPGQETMRKGCVKIFEDWMAARPAGVDVTIV